MGVALRVCACVLAGCAVWCASRVVIDVLSQKRRTARVLTLDDVLEDATLRSVLFVGFAFVVAFAFALWLLPVLLVCACVLSRRMPALLEKRRAEQLRSACEGQLDVMADVVALGVRSGLSFDAALAIYCQKFDGELSKQLAAAQQSWRSGLASREQALCDVASRIGSDALRRFAETVTQAIRYGSPLAELLVKFAQDMRRQRRAALERQVAKAPVKMLLPLGACILPAMLVLVMGPVMLQFVNSGL